MFNIGDKVRFVNAILHWDEPEFYPRVGTVGEVVTLFDREPTLLVQWEDGSTSDGDCWCCCIDDVEVIA